jgi:erythromycin esterase-like protein
MLRVLFIAFLCLPVHAQSVPISPGDEDALNAATQRLCHSQISMVGESATHGDGHTLAFKGALVERLIDQCGFDSVFFEASHYEFVSLDRRLRMRQAVTAGDVSSAVGGLWEFNQEFRPLVSFLLARAQAGRVFLGGIDDQLGERGQDYANKEMVIELTNLLPRQEQQACSVALHKRIYNDYTDASPYSKSDHALIETCLSEINRASAAAKTIDREGKGERQEMISAAQRWISRDFSSDTEYMVNRDRSMFQNFEWLLKRRKRHKVIVWAATVHIAKQADPTWGDRTGTNFGSFVHQKYGDRVFSLGFSGLTGTYKEVGREVQGMPAAPPDSVEAQALRDKNSDAIYVGSAQLAAMGVVPGAFFRHSYQTLSWSTFLDGVVIFREEHPPSRAGGK